MLGDSLSPPFPLERPEAIFTRYLMCEFVTLILLRIPNSEPWCQKQSGERFVVNPRNPELPLFPYDAGLSGCQAVARRSMATT